RRDHRPAHGAPGGGIELPADRPAVDRLRRGLFDPGRPHRPARALPRRASHRRRDGVLRRAVLRDRAAPSEGGIVTAVDLSGVSVAYNGSRVLREFTLHVGSGRWVCLIGPNGSGKTTALRAIAGVVGYQGTVRIGDAEPGALGRREIARAVAVVPQVPVIPGAMPVSDYVLMGRTPHIPYLGTENSRDREVTGAVLAQLDLAPLAHRRMGSLSGGELQRAVLARALVQEAPVLLLDEPTTGLDVGHQQQVLELVDGLRVSRELTVVSTMHDLTI